MARFITCLTLLSFLLALTCAAQQYPYPGFPMFSTQLGSQYDQIDIADGNISLSLPLRSIASGPLPLNYVLFGASNAYIYNYHSGDPSSYWFITIPSFAVTTQVGAQLTNSIDPEFATCNGNLDTLYSNFAVTDSFGTAHPLNILPFDSQGCYTFPAGTYPAEDGSGYTFVLSGTNSSWITALYDKFGNQYSVTTNASSSTSTVVTANNVTAQMVSTSLNCPGNTYPCTTTESFTDALTSTPVVVYQAVMSSGITNTSATYSYVNVLGNMINPPYSVSYSTPKRATNFGCSGIGESTTAPQLISSITTPTGGAYSFTYEPTPNMAGYVTGRIASITLPSGGTISYSYSGGNNGINCSNGVVPTLTRKISDNNGHVDTWIYVNSNTATSLYTNYTVVVTDPASNQTIYYMQGQFQTQVLSFEGGCTPTTVTGCNGGGTLLKTVTTCYNGVFSNCATPPAIIAGPPGANFPQTDVYTSYNGGPNNLIETKYDTYGNPLEVKSYDFGVNTGSAPTSSPLSDTLTYYGQSWNGTACNAYPSGIYILTTPCYMVTKDGAGNIHSQTKITYSNTGHPTSTAKWTSGTSWLTSTATYNSNGTIATSTDVNNAVTTYSYNGNGGCNNLLLTSTAFPVDSLTTSQTWDCNGGVLASSTDANGQITQFGYVNEKGTADPLWRRLSVTDPLLNVTWTDYSVGGTLPETVETHLSFPVSSPTSTVDTLNTLDGLGRVIKSQKRTAPGATTFDSAISYTYGWTSTGSVTGPFMTQTVPGGTAVTTTQLDALGRTNTLTDGGGGTASYTYSSQDVLVALGPASSGEGPKSKQSEYDGLGRLTSLCEITAGTTQWPGGKCNQVTSKTGYWTTYTYNTLNTTVSQNAQSSSSQGRSYSSDGLNRLISETNPESGTTSTSYTFDSIAANYCTGSAAYSSSSDLVAKADQNGNHICYKYDGLHRLTDVTNNSQSSTNFCKRFRFDTVSNGITTQPSGATITYVVGRLVEAETDNCSTPLTPITDEWFSYDKDGRLTDMWELTPHSGQYYHSTAMYQGNDTINAITSLQLVSPSLYTMSWGLDGEGRPKTLTDTTSNTSLVTGATYWPSVNPAVVNLTGSDKDTYTYDSNTGRMTKYVFNVGSSSMTGTLNWNANGTLNQLTITDGFNAGGSQTCNYNSANAANTGYDDLGRLIGFDCGTGQWGQAFSYDPFGNLTKTKMSSRNGTTWNPGYNESNNHCNGCSYDADGNVEGDGNNVYGWDVYSKLAWTAPSGIPSCGTSGRCITYDAFGRAVEQSNNSTFIERWITPIGETAYMSGTSSNYAYWPAPGGGTVVILGTNNYDYFHQDWLGNARITSGLSNHVAGTDQAYSPFGELYDIFGSGAAEFEMFAGLTGDFDPSTTTPVMWDTLNRELSMVGRWLSPDPAGLGAVDPSNPQTWNRYAYLKNNPLSAVDPTGLDGCDGDVCVVQAQPCSDSESTAICNDASIEPDGQTYVDGWLPDGTPGWLSDGTLGAQAQGPWPWCPPDDQWCSGPIRDEDWGTAHNCDPTDPMCNSINGTPVPTSSLAAILAAYPVRAVCGSTPAGVLIKPCIVSQFHTPYGPPKMTNTNLAPLPSVQAPKLSKLPTTSMPLTSVPGMTWTGTCPSFGYLSWPLCTEIQSPSGVQ